MARKAAPASQEVFLSHSHRNHVFADKLASTMRSYGVRVWYSKTSIVGAQQWHDEIGSALGRCDWFVVVLSPSSVKARWVKHELLYALNDSRYEGRIVPIMYKKCDASDLSWTLPTFQFVDFTHGYSTGCRALLPIWGLSYRGAP